jgi:TRAP transporter 4TM/12TM fusion protein
MAMSDKDNSDNSARDISPVIRNLSYSGAGLMSVLSILWGLQVNAYLGIPLFKEQFLAVMLGLVLGVIFLTTRFSGKRGGVVPWFDAFLAALSIATMFYIAFDYRRFQIEFPYGPLDMVIIGTLVVVLVLEGLRRAVGKVLFFIVIFFIVYGLVGHLIPSPFTGRYSRIDNLLIYLGFDANAALGLPLTVATSIVLPFIIFGKLIVKTGGGEFFLDLAMAIMGRRRGGAAKISVISSALFGSISGSAVSNVATTGVMTIPLMTRSGYSRLQAGAIETIASTGGQFMPPIMGAAAFLMAEFLEIAYAEVVIAGLVPALLYYLAVFAQVDLVAARYKITVTQEHLPLTRDVLKDGWHFIVPFLVMLYCLFILNFEAEIAALYASVAIIAGGSIRAYKGIKLSISNVFSCLWEAGLTMLSLIIIVTVAGFVIGVLNISSGGFVLTMFMIELGGGQLFILLTIAAIICIILGMGMPTSGVYVLLAALVVPGLVEVGVLPLSAHMFILYFGMMSMITPPIALAAFAAATISGASPMKTGFESMRLGWTAYVVPFLFVLSPTLLLRGEPGQIILNVFTAFVGVYIVSVSVVGYFTRRLSAVHRIGIAIAGLLAMVPDTTFPFGGFISLAGALMGALMLGSEFLLVTRANRVTVE